MKRVLLSLGASIIVFSAVVLSQSMSNQSTAMKASGQGSLLVVSQGNDSVTEVDPASGTKLISLATKGVRAHEVAVSPDGRLAYLPIYGDAGVGMPGSSGRTVEILDLEKGALTGSMTVRLAPACLQRSAAR